MRHVILNVVKYENRVGFVPVMYKDWASPTLNLGHDLLEHGMVEDGSLKAEIIAIGRSLWVFDLFQESNRPEIELGVQVYTSLLDNSNDLEYCKLKDVKIEALWGKASEWISKKGFQTWLTVNHDTIVGWLTFGYRNAAKRYKSYNSLRVRELKKLINKECRAAKPVCGQYRISYSIKHMRVKCLNT